MSGSDFKAGGALLAYIGRTATANSEEDLDELLGLLNPAESEKKAGENLTKALGYNPITFYDRRKVIELLDELIDYDGNPDETLSPIAKRHIRDMKEEIADQVMDSWPETKAQAIRDILPAFLDVVIDEVDVEKAARRLGSNYESISDEMDDDGLYDDDDGEDLELGDEDDDIDDDGLMPDDD